MQTGGTRASLGLNAHVQLNGPWHQMVIALRHPRHDNGRFSPMFRHRASRRRSSSFRYTLQFMVISRIASYKGRRLKAVTFGNFSRITFCSPVGFQHVGRKNLYFRRSLFLCLFRVRSYFGTLLLDAVAILTYTYIVQTTQAEVPYVCCYSFRNFFKPNSE